jgi:hypothetical protein
VTEVELDTSDHDLVIFVASDDMFDPLEDCPFLDRVDAASEDILDPFKDCPFLDRISFAEEIEDPPQ